FAHRSADSLPRNPITGIVECCARRERPRRRAAEQRDEVAPFYLTEMHPIPSRAGSASQDTGLQRISQRVCERFTTRGSILERPQSDARSEVQTSPDPKPDRSTQQNSATDTGIIVRAPLCAPKQAKQQSGRVGSSNTRPAPRSPPQAKAS